MRVVNSTSVLEDRLTDDKITIAGTNFTSQEMHEQVMLIFFSSFVDPILANLWKQFSRGGEMQNI